MTTLELPEPVLGRFEDAGPNAAIERILELARTQLGMEIAFVSQFADGLEIVRNVSGDAESFGLEAGLGVPLEDTYCQRLVDGRLPNVVKDAKRNPIVSDLRATREADIGAYVGVPVQLWDGEVYGTLCCLSHTPDATLSDRDVKFMHVLAQTVAEHLDRERLESEKLRIESDRIRDVLARRDVDVVFQPVVPLDGGAPIAFEALARFWREPNRPPSEWFAEAAEVGLGVELELAALETALQCLDDLAPNASLAINVSPDTILSPAFSELVQDIAPRLVIEITEHARVASYEELAEALAPLRARGARVAVDDVGAGFASLRHILRLAPDIVKLDLSLTKGIADDPARVALASSLVNFATDVDATIVAEGIETAEELAVLRGLGVMYGQGFYLGRPTAILH